jgi:hypothetical protein
MDVDINYWDSTALELIPMSLLTCVVLFFALL